MLSLVVPYRGTWVETLQSGIDKRVTDVVPYRGTWVETRVLQKINKYFGSRTL